MKLLRPNRTNYSVRRPDKYLCDWEGTSLSKFQKRVKVFLRPYWENDIVFEEFPLPHRMSLDFLNISRKIAVEVQGAQHIKYIKHFHKNKIGYLSQLKRDSYKLDFCSANDIVLVEVYPDDEISEEIFTSKGLVL